MQLAAAAESKKWPRPGKKLAHSFPLPSPSEPKCFDSSDQLFDSPFVFAAGGSSQLLYLYDDHNGLDFLVDTGATVSLFPHQSVQPCGPRRLCQADGSALPSWGRRNLKLSFAGREFNFSFLLAAVDRPILGINTKQISLIKLTIKY